MKLSEVCVQRPVLAWVFTFILMLLGAVGFDRLPVQKMPNIENVFLTIETQMPGVGPDIIESQITRHIEDAVSGIEGIETISSVSSAEESKVMIEFRPGRSMDNAVNDIRDRLYRVKEKLPQANLRTEPMIMRNRTDERPIMALALTSTRDAPSILYDYAENDIKKELESIAGVARIDIAGASSYKMKIDVNPLKMAGYKVNVHDVREAIDNQNFESPAGTIESKNRKYNVTTVADLMQPDEFDNIIIRADKGRIVRIKDIGKAYINADDKRTRTRFNGEQGVQISITKQSNANPLQVAKDVHDVMVRLKKRLPTTSKLDIASDSTKYIEKSIKNVYWSIAEASILVVLVVFLFLQSARASLIPLITIPVSLLGVAFLMYLLGYTLNMFTLFAMVLAVGLVVDDAIVVLENIHRHMEEGLNGFKAAIKGIREVGFSIIAMTLTLVAVYLPIPLGSGKLAKYFTEFAITLAGAVLISGFVALTLSPMMCARLLKVHKKNDDQASEGQETANDHVSFADRLPHNAYWQNIKQRFSTEKWLVSLENLYGVYLSKALNNRRRILQLSFMIGLLGVWVYSFMRSEPAPQEDNRAFRVEAHAPATATLKYTERYVAEIDKILETYPEVSRRIFSIINPNVDILIELKEESSSLFQSILAFFKPRERSTDEVMASLKKRFSKITGLDPQVKTGGGSSDANYVEFVIRGNKDATELDELKFKMSSAIHDTGLVTDLRGANTTDVEDYIILLNRDKIANIQKTPRDIAYHIRYLLKGEKTNSRFKKDNKQYDIDLQVFAEFKQSPEDILKLFIKGGTPKEPVLIPLSELVSVESRTSPHEINRYNRTRAIQVLGILAPGRTVGEAISTIENVAFNILPEGVQLEFTGETRRYINESKSMYLVFVLSLLFIYLIMAAQFESWRDPFIIFFSVPLSLVGGVFALAQMDKGTLNMFSFIGFVTLIGLITKHGILIVDFANRLREHGTLSIQEAISKACQMRLRPILMTTFAMVLGAVPLMFGGAGNESRRQLGAVIIGGMSLGTLFTLFIVPVMYTFITAQNKYKKIK